MTPGVPSYLPGTPGGQPMTPGTGGLEPTSPAIGKHLDNHDLDILAIECSFSMVIVFSPLRRPVLQECFFLEDFVN